MKTIKQWFERVADAKLRTELLDGMVKAHVQVRSLSEAIAEGVRWNKIAQNGQNYWNIIHFRAFNNQIELLPDTPKIQKSALDKRITGLTKRIEELEEIVKSISQPIQKDPFWIDPFGKTTIYNENEQTNVVGNSSDLPGKKIVFDWFISGDGKLITPRVSAIQYINAKEIAQIGYNKYIFKSYDNDPLVYTIYIGHYE
jgi:hypothetical protein